MVVPVRQRESGVLCKGGAEHELLGPNRTYEAVGTVTKSLVSGRKMRDDSHEDRTLRMNKVGLLTAERCQECCTEKLATPRVDR